jgi:hypothetical protein
MNVKISYTIPFERVPSKVDELLGEAGRTLEGVGSLVRPIQFEEDGCHIIQKLEKIDKMRRDLMAVDLLLEDCYTILAGYNKALADMKMPPSGKQEIRNDRMADEGGSSIHPAEGSDNKI